MATAGITNLPLGSQPPRKRLRRWLRGVARDIRHAFGRMPEQPAAVAAGAAVAAAEQKSLALDDAVLRFPIRGEALLVRLATALRDRFGECGPDGNPLQFTISRGAHLRLTIDRCAYVEVQRRDRAFRLAVEASQDTTLWLETGDIDIIVGFVTRYIGEKLVDGKEFEAAS